MNILSLDSPYSPFFSQIISTFDEPVSFTAIFSKCGYKHYFSGSKSNYIGCILRKHKTFTNDDLHLAQWSNNHYSAYVRKFENRELSRSELENFAKFANYFRHYLKSKKIDFVMMHNDLRWHHAIAREICIEEGVPFCVSELGLFRPYTMTLDFHGVNANSSITTLDIDFSQFGNLPDKPFDVPDKFYGHESKKSKLNFAYFLILNKLGGLLGFNSPILHNAFKIRPYIKRFWEQSVKPRFNQSASSVQLDDLPKGKYVFFPMQLENDTQFLIHSDFSSNQELLNQVEKAFLSSTLAADHTLVVKLHPNDLGSYESSPDTVFSRFNTTELVNNACSIISVNSTVCMEALETEKPLYVLGRAFFARGDVCEPCDINELSSALSNPKPVNVLARKGFIHYLKYNYSIQGAGFSFTLNELKVITDKIQGVIKGRVK